MKRGEQIPVIEVPSHAIPPPWKIASLPYPIYALNLLALITAFLVLLPSANLLAQQHSQPNDYVYRSVTITAGGYVPRLIAHPTEPGLIYTRTDIGSVYRWEAQDHRWQPLTDFQTPADYNGTNPPAPERALINRDGDLYVTFDDLPGPNVIDYGRRFANYLGSGALLVKGHPPV